MTVLKEVPGLPELTPGGPDRLAVVFSAPFGWSADASATSEAGLPLAYHGRTLQCAATLAARNLAGATPFDLYFVAPPEIIKCASFYTFRTAPASHLRVLNAAYYPTNLAIPGSLTLEIRSPAMPARSLPFASPFQAQVGTAPVSPAHPPHPGATGTPGG